MTGRFVRTLAGVLAAVIMSAGVARADAPVLTTEVNGNAVTFNWTSTAGATGYRIDAGLASGVYNLGSQALGAVNTIGLPGVPNGVYFVRVVALPGGEPSNEVRLQLPAPPAAPTNLQVVRNGTAIVATWDAGAGGGAISAYQLRVGLAPGGTDFPINTVANTFAAGPVPSNTYYFRVVALNAAGASSDSNEVTVFMPAAGACDAPPAVSFNQFVFSSYISLSWTSVPTATNYLATVSFNGASQAVDLPVGPVTSVRRIVPLGTWEVTIKAQFACGSTGAPATTTLVVDGAPPPGPRTPDPA
ncbi:MAG TPA: fibronectin type III domain-containing protein, partial [Vicinamibacterales bacterium]|nr:fibronectin type III domain-containing protein [Vicinamibacterales bacterium]